MFSDDIHVRTPRDGLVERSGLRREAANWPTSASRPTLPEDVKSSPATQPRNGTRTGLQLRRKLQMEALPGSESPTKSVARNGAHTGGDRWWDCCGLPSTSGNAPPPPTSAILEWQLKKLLQHYNRRHLLTPLTQRTLDRTAQTSTVLHRA